MILISIQETGACASRIAYLTQCAIIRTISTVIFYGVVHYATNNYFVHIFSL